MVSADGGSVTVAVDAVPTTLNDHTPAGDDAATRSVASLVWAQVFQVGPKDAPKLDTDVVQSAEVVSVAPQTIVYQIDPRAVWSDGTPVNAQDFVYAWLSQAGPGRDVDGTVDSVASSDGYRNIASVVGSNNGKTVTVVFQTPYADWPSLFSDLLPAHVAGRVGWNHGFDHFDPAHMLSAGPFVVASWTPGRALTLARNPRWWGTPARLDQVVLEVTPGAPAMAAALRAGGAQVAEPVAFDQGFQAAVSSSAHLRSTGGLGSTALQLVFDLRHGPTEDVDVRQGIAHLLDRGALISSLVQPLDPLVWEDNDHLFANLQPWYTDDAGPYEQPDPAGAARLLAAGGLVPDDRGTWTARGAPVVLHLAWASDDAWSATVAPALAAQLVAAGFDVQSAPVPSAQLFGTVLPAGAFDLALAPLATGPFPSRLLHSFGAPMAAPTAPDTNWSGFDDPKVDALFDQASQQLAADQARQLYQQIDAELWVAMPTLPLFAEPYVMASDASLASVHADPGGPDPLWGAAQWSLLVAAGTHRASLPAQGRSGH